MRGGLDGGEESNKLIRRGRDTIEPRQIQSRVDLAEYRVSGRRQLRPDRWISPPPPRLRVFHGKFIPVLARPPSGDVEGGSPPLFR